MAGLGKLSAASEKLLKIQTELQSSLEKTLTRKDLAKLTEIDVSVIAFIKKVRQSQEWGQTRHLEDKEIEVIFGILDEQHGDIM